MAESRSDPPRPTVSPPPIRPGRSASSALRSFRSVLGLKQVADEMGSNGNVARACELLEVSRSAYYAHAAARAAGGPARQRADAKLTGRITLITAESAGTTGPHAPHPSARA